jgi:hypothetical protein
METTGLRYNFIAKPWQYIGTGSWTFISLPESIAKEIRDNLMNPETFLSGL